MISDAWQQVFFSEASDACLKRYYGFQLEGIPDHPGTLSLCQSLISRYGAYLDDSLLLPAAYPWPETAALQAAISASALPPGLQDCLLAYFRAMRRKSPAALAWARCAMANSCAKHLLN